MSHKKAQTIIELAAFGSILIFLLGVIIRQGLSFGYIQHQNLKAMRTALATSYKYSEGIALPNSFYKDGVASRNQASIMLVEDRLSADASKYGSVDRNPYVNGASAVHSRNLFLPLDVSYDVPPDTGLLPGEIRKLPNNVGETYNLAMFDLMVNGVHFPLTTAAFAEISMTDPFGIPDTSASPPKMPNYKYYYTIVANHWLSDEWCIEGEDCPCIRKPNIDDEKRFIEIDPLTCEKFPAKFRFDLRRCNDNDPLDPDRKFGDRGPSKFNMPDCSPMDPDYILTDAATQEKFSWSWTVIDGQDIKKGDSVDLDRDLKEERVITVDTKNNKIIYVDAQLGDVDFTMGDHEGKVQPGLQSDVSIMTQTKDGTYLFINEGRLFNASQQYVRTASKKDSLDLVQRIYQLSNDTGRFCTGGSSPTPNLDSKVWYEDARNPVEVCSRGDCFSSANIDKICMDLEPNPKVVGEPPVIYIRSRIIDKHGRNWVTDESGDLYINFKRP